MSTRGIVGFRKNGVDKLTFNCYDSYPDGLGEKVLDFCNDNSIEELNKLFDKIILVKGDSVPTDKEMKKSKNGRLLMKQIKKM